MPPLGKRLRCLTVRLWPGSARSATSHTAWSELCVCRNQSPSYATTVTKSNSSELAWSISIRSSTTVPRATLPMDPARSAFFDKVSESFVSTATRTRATTGSFHMIRQRRNVQSAMLPTARRRCICSANPKSISAATAMSSTPALLHPMEACQFRRSVVDRAIRPTPAPTKRS